MKTRFSTVLSGLLGFGCGMDALGQSALTDPSFEAPPFKKEPAVNRGHI